MSPRENVRHPDAAPGPRRSPANRETRRSLPTADVPTAHVRFLSEYDTNLAAADRFDASSCIQSVSNDYALEVSQANTERVNREKPAYIMIVANRL